LKSTLCWDCGNACGGCSWSQELKPVKGWNAKKSGDSFTVKQCPKFVRNAWNGGQYRSTIEGTEDYVHDLNMQIANLTKSLQNERQKCASLKQKLTDAEDQLMAIEIMESTHYAE